MGNSAAVVVEAIPYYGVVAAAEQGTTNIEQRTLRAGMWWEGSCLRLKAGKIGNQTVVVAVVVVVVVEDRQLKNHRLLLMLLFGGI